MAPTPASSAGPSSEEEGEKTRSKPHELSLSMSGECIHLLADSAHHCCTTSRAASERESTHADDQPSQIYSACAVPGWRSVSPSPGWELSTGSFRQRWRKRAVKEQGNLWIFIPT